MTEFQVTLGAMIDSIFNTFFRLKISHAYDAVLATLGVPPGMVNKAGTGHTRVFYRHEGNSFGISEPIDSKPATFANGGTIGFKCTSACVNVRAWRFRC